MKIISSDSAAQIRKFDGQHVAPRPVAWPCLLDTDAGKVGLRKVLVTCVNVPFPSAARWETLGDTFKPFFFF